MQKAYVLASFASDAPDAPSPSHGENCASDRPPTAEAVAAEKTAAVAAEKVAAVAADKAAAVAEAVAATS